MKRLLLFPALAAALFATLISCQTEDPLLTDTPDVTVTPAALHFPLEGGDEQSVVIESNRPWKITIPDAIQEDFLRVSNSSGPAGKTTITVTAKQNYAETRTYKIAVHASTATAFIAVDQAGESTVVWKDNLGTNAPDGGAAISAWEAENGFNREGDGIQNMKYTGMNTTVRTTNPSPTPQYSGSNNVLFSSGSGEAWFQASNILVSGLNSATLSFAAYNYNGNVDSDKLKVTASFDGADPFDLPFTSTSTTRTWSTIAIPMTIPAGTSMLTLKWTCTYEENSYRIDDPKLTSADEVTLPLIPAVTDAEITALSKTTATFAWTYLIDPTSSTVVTKAGIACKPASQASYTGLNYYELQSGVMTPPYTLQITGLTEGEEYDFMPYVEDAGGTKYYGPEGSFTPEWGVDDALLYETMGPGAASGETANPAVADYHKWSRQGVGAAGVTYSGVNASARVTYTSNGYTVYDRETLPTMASEGANIFLAALSNSFTISDIDLSTATASTATLSFGGRIANSAADPYNLLVSVKTDADAGWRTLVPDYSLSNTHWGYFQAEPFALTPGATKLSIRFDGYLASEIRIDDVLVIEGGTVTPHSAPTAITRDFTGRTRTTVTLNGQYIAGTTAVTATGFQWRKQGEGTWNNTAGTAGDNNTFTAALTGLIAGTTYEYKATATAGTVAEGAVKQFTTAAPLPGGSNVILFENMGSTNVTSNTNPEASGSYPATHTWLREGLGAAAVKYTGTTGSTQQIASIRTSLTNDTNYTEDTEYNAMASRGNVIFFGMTSAFTAANINVDGLTSIYLSFGHSSAASTPASGDFKVEYQLDAGSWTTVACTPSPLAKGSQWYLVQATDAIQINGAKRMAVRFTSNTTSGTSGVYRIDDIGITSNQTPNPIVPVVTTDQTVAPRNTGATVTGSYDYEITSPAVTEKGIEWRVKNTDPWHAIAQTTGLLADPSISVNIPDETLTANTDYEARAYVKTSAGTYRGAAVTFKTLNINPPAVTTTAATGVYATSATLNATFVNGDVTVTAAGFEYKVGEGGTYTSVNATGILSPLTATITGLTPNTTYYFRAWATGGAKAYSTEVLSFITQKSFPGGAYTLYYEDMGATDVGSNTNLGSFSGWSKTGPDGTKQEAITYEGEPLTNSITIRKSTPSNTYENVSGGNNVFLAAAPETGSTPGDDKIFQINNINVNGVTSATLSFGAAKVEGSPKETSGFDANLLKVYVRANNATDWTQVTYTPASTSAASDNWFRCTGNSISIPVGAKLLSIKFVHSYYSGQGRYKIDDVALTSNLLPGARWTGPTVATTTYSSVTATGVTLNGTCTTAAGTPTQTGFLVKKSTQADADYVRHAATGTATFTAAITGLAPETAYRYKAFAVVDGNTYYGPLSTGTVTTSGYALPVVTTDAVTVIGETTATVSGSYDPKDYIAANSLGIDKAGVKIYDAGGTRLDSIAQAAATPFSQAFTGLTAGTPYKAQAFVLTLDGKLVNGNLSGFTTSSSVPIPAFTATLDGAFRQSKAMTAANKITVSYTNATAGTINFTVDITGAGAAGITAAATSATLVNGTGSFDIALSGTPTATGQANFVINSTTAELNGKTMSTIVAEASTLASLLLNGLGADNLDAGGVLTSFADDSYPTTATITKFGGTGGNAGIAFNAGDIAGKGWTDEASYWLIAIPVADAVNGSITLTLRSQGSNTGPKNMKAQYSNSATVWPANDGAYVYTGTYTMTASAANKTVTFNIAEANQVAAGGVLYIKLSIVDQTPISGTSFADAGTNRLASVTVKQN